MLLDQRTLAVVLAAVLLLQGIGWLLIWRNQPRTPGVRYAFIASLLFVPGLTLVSLRGQVSPWISDVLANYLGIGGLLLTLFALAAMAERPLPKRLGIAFYALNLLIWPLYAILVPGQPGWIALLGAVPGVGFGLLCAREALAARQAPRVICGLLATLNIVHALVAMLRFADGVQQVQTGRGLVPQALLGIFYLEFILYAAFFFIGIVALLGSRLAFALVQQNEMLLREADQRRQLQTELSAALAEESAARREQRHFLDMVSHEFRTPLAIMDRAAEMIALTLADKPEAAKELAEVTAMRAEGQRLRLMIDAFLAQERLQSGLGEPRRENFDAVALLEELRDSLDTDLQDRLHLLMPVNCPANGDPDLCRIAIASLLDVALNEPGGSGAVTLRLERRDSQAQISFEGSASGISPGIGMVAEQDGDEPEALGLITARRLFEAQGGTLLLAPDAGPGRLAVARLPLAVAVAAK